MAMYKDAEEIASVLEKYKNYIDIGKDTPLFVVIIECVKSVIAAVPAVDAVEVVRCKDCKYRKNVGIKLDFYMCELDTGDPFEYSRHVNDDNWYCADGERRE